MKFEEVLPALLDGKKIRRKSWVNGNCIVIKNTEIMDDFDRRLAISVEGFKADDWEIVKTPKKVKLRDLTEEQYDKWLEINCRYGINCWDCLFRRVDCGCNDYSDDETVWYLNKDLYSDKFLDQEIEINDDDD